MANITNPTNIPAGAKPDIKEIAQIIGPTVLGNKWPEGLDPANLTATQVGQVFELVTREFWRQQIASHKANKAAEAARQTALTGTDSDPFGAP